MHQIMHTNMVSETIQSEYHSNTDNSYMEDVPNICEECG